MVALGWIVSQTRKVWDALSRRRVRRTGGGVIYATCVGQAVKRFPYRRGLAVGFTSAGYGAGAASTVVSIRAVIASGGYEAAFFWFGLTQGGIIFIPAWLLRAPDPGELLAPLRRTSCRLHTTGRPRSFEHAGVLYPLHHVHHGVGIGPDGDCGSRRSPRVSASGIRASGAPSR